jgi:hypothetical protein
MLIISVFVSSCLPTQNVSSKRTAIANSTNSNTGTGQNSNGTGAVANTNSTNTTSISSQKIELSHLVDPFTGTYKKKITIPKNYKGYLYIAGLNLSALSSKIIKVRLNFGVDRQTIALGATLARAPGITPKTDIQVLVLDLNTRPFQDMRLPYDLYDYNDYNNDSTLEPVTDPSDGGLYCRGTRLEDDPTYIVSSSSSSCASTADKCLYSYAKIADAAFYNSSDLTTTPTKPQIWDYATTFDFSLIPGMCFPDAISTYTDYISALVPTSSSTYIYKGPYRPINQSSWNISSAAIFGSATTGDVISGFKTTYTGLFEPSVFASATDKTTWYKSLLFPRAGRLDLAANVNYFGSSSKFGERGKLTSDPTGTSQYVDGCNIRALNYNSATNEGIGSCNVLGNLEIYYMNGTSEVNITTTNSLKIQLTRASITNSEGKQVLSSSFKTCDSSNACGAEECCYNSRCWSKDLVSQCVDTLSSTGNREIGTACSSDYQCASLCCNTSTGSCAPHNTNGTNPILCAKSAGQSCVSTEFCAQEYVPVCKLYKNGYNLDGTVKCDIRCPTVATYGTCFGGACVAPKGSTDTSGFDLVKCTGAIDP